MTNQNIYILKIQEVKGPYLNCALYPARFAHLNIESDIIPGQMFRRQKARLGWPGASFYVGLHSIFITLTNLSSSPFSTYDVPHFDWL